MKLIYLLLGMCILLLSSVSATVVIWDMPQPVIKAEAVATGGDNALGANNTFMQCFYQYGSGYYGNFVSPASAQINVTTSVAKPYINLSWGFYNKSGDWVDGFYVPEGSVIGLTGNRALNLMCKWDYYNMTNPSTGVYYQWYNYNDPDAISDNIYYYGHRRWTDMYYQVAMPELKYPHTDDILDADNLKDGVALADTKYNGRMFFQPEIAWMEQNYTIYAGGSYQYMIDLYGTQFNLTHGKLGIELTSVDDDWCDVYDALLSNESYADRFMLLGKHADNACTFKDYQNHLILFGSFFESISSTDYFELSGVDITLFAGQFIDGCADISFDNVILSIIHAGWIAPLFKVKSTKLFTYGSSLVLTGTQIVSGFAPWVAVGGGMTIYGYPGALTYYGGMDLSDVYRLDFRYPNANGRLTNMNYYDARLYITIRYNKDIYLYNQSFHNLGGKYDAYDWWEDWYSGQTDPCMIYCTNCISDRANGVVKILYDDTLTPPNYLNYSFMAYHNFEVTGTDGTTGLAGVNITCIDNNSNSYNGETDANGALSLWVLNYLVYNDDPLAGHVDRIGNYTYNGKWECESKNSGYITKNIVIEGYGDKDRYIKLQKPVYRYIATSNEVTEGLVIG